MTPHDAFAGICRRCDRLRARVLRARPARRPPCRLPDLRRHRGRDPPRRGGPAAPATRHPRGTARIRDPRRGPPSGARSTPAPAGARRRTACPAGPRLPRRRRGVGPAEQDDLSVVLPVPSSGPTTLLPSVSPAASASPVAQAETLRWVRHGDPPRQSVHEIVGFAGGRGPPPDAARTRGGLQP